MDRAIKILFLAANPKDTSPLRLDEEMRGIDQALRQSEFRDKFDIKQQWAVRITDLQGYFLRHKPDIVHFSGHGSSSSEIVLEDNDGNSQSLSIDALSQLFSLLKDNIRCVVLNACYSEPQAKAIAKHIDCVIGMSKAIGDEAAINFTAAFYQALGYGRDVKTAFDLGCSLINLRNLNEQDTPKLFAINSNPQKIVFVYEALNTKISKPTKLLKNLKRWQKVLSYGDEHNEAIKPKRISLLITITMSVILLFSILLWQYFKSQPTKKTLVLVANFDGPEPQKYRVTETILDQLRDAIGKYQDIKVQALGKTVTAIHGNDLAEEIGKQKKASIVLWGWYALSAEKALINVHFKVLEKPKYLSSIREKQTLNILVTEFENFEIQIQLSNEMSYFTLLTLGLLRYESGDYKTAISLYTEALVQSKLTRQSINPAITYFRRGIAYLANGVIDSAIVDFSHAIAFKHDYGYAYINRGIAYFTKNEVDKAIFDYDRAIKLLPMDADAHNNRGVAYFRNGNYNQAISDYTNALKFDPDYFNSYINRGIAYFEKSKTKLAIDDFNKAIKLNSNDANAYDYLGLAYHQQGNYRNAITSFNQAIMFESGNAVFYNHRALANYANQDYDKAIADYEQAIKLRPNDDIAQHNLGIVHLKKGEIDSTYLNDEMIVQQIRLDLILDNNEELRRYTLNSAIAMNQQTNLDSIITKPRKFIQLIRSTFKLLDGSKPIERRGVVLVRHGAKG